MNAEEVKVGCFQIALVIFLGVNYVVVAMSHSVPVFHNYTPRFYCQPPNTTTRLYGCQTDDSTREEDSNGTLSSRSCPGRYEFIVDPGSSSVATEWSLICDKELLAFLGPSVYYAGLLIGAWISGPLADRIGRLPVQAICLYTQGTMAVALYVVQNYPTFLAVRGLQGVFVQGLQNSTYILSLELFPARARTLIALVMHVAWASGLVLLAGLSHLVPDWRILQLAVSVPTAITVLYIWIVPESPRWLLAKGKSTEADMALERIAKYNGCCARKQREPAPIKPDAPVKPERKSRLSTVDVRQAKDDEETREEAANLLTASEVPRKKSRKASMQAITENLEASSKEEKREVDSENGPEVESRERAASSRSNRRTKSISQPISEQRASLANPEEIVELRPAARKRLDDESEIKNTDVEENKERIRQDLKEFIERPLARKYSLIMILQWFSCFMVYHLVESLAPDYRINRHVSFALGGGLELASYVFVYFALSRFGRRLPLGAFQFSNGAICIITALLIIVPDRFAVWTDLAKSVTLLVGRVAVAGTVFTIYLYTVEIFPTVIRGTCLGFCAGFARLASLVAPHAIHWGGDLSDTVTLAIAGVSCFASGILGLLLPETMDKILPDAVEDMDRLKPIVNGTCAINESSNGATVVKDARDGKESREDSAQRDILRDKLFSEDWVDAGNGILVNFSETKTEG